MAMNIGGNLGQSHIVTTPPAVTIMSMTGQQHQPVTVTGVTNLNTGIPVNTGQTVVAAPHQVLPTSQLSASSGTSGVVGIGVTGGISAAAGTHSTPTVGTVLQGVVASQAAVSGISSVVSSMQGSGVNVGVTQSSSVANTLASQLKTSSSSSASVPAVPENQVLTRLRLQDLVREVDPAEQLDEDVEELLLQLADDFVESTVNAACLLAKHRRANTVEVKDVQLHLERNWNMWIPGFGTDELRPFKRAAVSEAHKQRMALIRKALKKY